MVLNNEHDIILNPPYKNVTCDQTLHSEECGCKYVIHMYVHNNYKRHIKIHYCEECLKFYEFIMDKPLKSVNKSLIKKYK